MGRGSRRNRKRKACKREAEGAPAAEPSMDVSVWWGDGDTNQKNVSATTIVPPAPLEVLHSPSDPRYDTMYSTLKASWKLLCEHLDWKEPTGVQRQAWPIIAEGCTNLIQISPTGSGKTVAYGLPMILKVVNAFVSDSVKRELDSTIMANCLVLVPTRELVQQVEQTFNTITESVAAKYSSHPVQSAACHGGADKQSQIKKIRKSRIVVSTPGRLLDLLENTDVKDQFSKLQTLVLDEADRLTMNKDLYSQVEEIAKYMQPSQTVLCSATWPDAVTAKWKKLLGHCIVVKVDSILITKRRKLGGPDVGDSGQLKTSACIGNKNVLLSRIPTNLTQILHVCAEHKKPKKLLSTLAKVKKNANGKKSPSLGIVFFNKIKGLEYINKFLVGQRIQCAALHSQLPQQTRETVLQNFTSGKETILLATDIAARGIHADNVSFVINYDFPSNLEQYVHRCGRAGRDGSSDATIYSFFTRNLSPLAHDLVSLLEAGNQMVDPNLRALCSVESKPVKQQSVKPKAPTKDANVNAAKNLSSDDDFRSDMPSADRIVLKRASHVSDASEDSSSEDGEPEEED